MIVATVSRGRLRRLGGTGRSRARPRPYEGFAGPVRLALPGLVEASSLACGPAPRPTAPNQCHGNGDPAASII